MSGKVVNLRAARKARDRAQDRQRADENSAKFGLTKAEKSADKSAIKKAQDHLDLHKRDGAPEG